MESFKVKYSTLLEDIGNIRSSVVNQSIGRIDGSYFTRNRWSGTGDRRRHFTWSSGSWRCADII